MCSLEFSIDEVFIESGIAVAPSDSKRPPRSLGDYRYRGPFCIKKRLEPRRRLALSLLWFSLLWFLSALLGVFIDSWTSLTMTRLAIR